MSADAPWEDDPEAGAAPWEQDPAVGPPAPKKSSPGRFFSKAGKFLANTALGAVGVPQFSRLASALSASASPEAEHLGRGALQGATLGFGDELSGAAQAYLSHAAKSTPPAVGNLLGIETRYPDELPGVGEAYRKGRDEDRAANEKAKAASPWLYGAGEVAGGLLSPANAVMAPFGAAKGASLGVRALKAAKTATALGGAAGLGMSKTDLTRGDPGEFGQAALDTGVGAGLGALVAPLAEVGMDKTIGALGRAAEHGGMDATEKALRGSAHSLSVKKPLSEAAKRAVVEEGGVLPGRTVAQHEEALGALRDSLGQEKADIVQKLTGNQAVGPSPHNLAADLRQTAASMKAVTPEAETARSYFRHVADLFESEFPHQPMDLADAEAMKTQLQAAASEEYSRVGGSKILGQAKKDVAAFVRQRIEDVIDQQDPTGGAAFKAIKARLGPVIEAHKVAERGAAQAARRGHYSLNDTIMGSLLGQGGLETLAAKEAHRQIRTRLPSALAVAGQKGGRALQKLAPTGFGGALGAAYGRSVPPEDTEARLKALGEEE